MYRIPNLARPWSAESTANATALEQTLILSGEGQDYRRVVSDVLESSAARPSLEP